MADYMPAPERELVTWVNNFLAVAGDNAAALGLSAADLADLAPKRDAFSDDINEAAAARARFESAVTVKETSRQEMQGDVRALVRRIQAHPGVSDALKRQLGVSVPSPVRNHTPPVPPADVQVMPAPNGVNSLKWSKAGNKSTTQYIVLAKSLTRGAGADADAGWEMVGQTTRSRFQHGGNTPGVPMAYKVLAARANQASLPSLPVTVYGG